LFDQLVRRWPECQAIRVVAVGGGQHSNDRSKTEVRKRLACWKIDNNNALAWPDGLPLVQWSVNTKFHTGLKPCSKLTKKWEKINGIFYVWIHF
jgi:hypothetical protein